MNFIVDYIDLDYLAYCSLAWLWLLYLWCLCIWQTIGTWYPCVPQRPTLNCMLRLHAQSNSRGQTSPFTEESSVPLNLLMSLFDENEDLSPIDRFILLILRMLGHRSRSDCFKHWIIVCLPLYNEHTWISLVHLYSKDHLTFVFNVVCLGFFLSHLRIFYSFGDVTIAGEGLQILSYARHSWPLIREGSLVCHTYCDTGHPSLRTRDTNTYCQVFSVCMAYALTHCATAPAVNNQVTSNLH